MFCLDSRVRAGHFIALSIARVCCEQISQLLSKGLNLEFRRAKLVPELIISNMAASKRFWVDLCGFSIAYSRDEEGFVYLDLNGSQVMLEELGDGRKWITAPLEAPLGRGVNFEIEVPELGPLLDNLAQVGWPLFMQPEEKWYRRDAVEVGVHQFLVQDPDGYLLRFQSSLGERPFSG